MCGMNCILADEMGLGKTVQVLGYLAVLLQHHATTVVGAEVGPGGAITLPARRRGGARRAAMHDEDDDEDGDGDDDDAETVVGEEAEVLVPHDASTAAAAAAAAAATSSSSNPIERLAARLESVRTPGGSSGVPTRVYHFFPPLLSAAAAAERAASPLPLASAGKHLIVCPSSVMSNWESEVRRFCPWLSAVLVRPTGGNREASRELKRRVQLANIVIVNYTAFERGGKGGGGGKGRGGSGAARGGGAGDDDDDDDGAAGSSSSRFVHDLVRTTAWDVLVLDEAHDLKNAASARFAAVQAIPAAHRILLTGTPVQNNVYELVSLLRFVAADLFLGCSGGVFGARGKAVPKAAAAAEGTVVDGDGEDRDDDDHVLRGVVDDEGDGDDDEEDEWDGDGDNMDDGSGDGSDVRGSERAHRAFADALAAGVKALSRKSRGAGAAASSSSSSSSSSTAAAALQDLLALFVLRRTKESANLALPPKHRHTEWLAPTPGQDAVLSTLHLLTLHVLGEGSILARAVATAVAGAAAGGEEAEAQAAGPTSVAATADGLAARPLAFVGQVGAALADAPRDAAAGTGAGSSSSSSSAAASSSSSGAVAAVPLSDALLEVQGSPGFAGRALMLLRKAAIHPLLLRTRFSTEDCLVLARLIQGVPPAADAASAAAGAAASSSAPVTREAVRLLVFPPASGAAGEAPTGAASSATSSSSSAAAAHLAAVHALPSPAELLAWAGGRKTLVRQAQALLGSSDYALSTLARSLPREQAARFALPASALYDSAKVTALLALLRGLREGEKALVFSQFTEALDLVEEILELEGEGFMRIDGQTDVGSRQRIIEAFSAAKAAGGKKGAGSAGPPRCRVMLLTTRAGGVGINLTCASTVVFLDADWSAQATAQAEDRAHRIGQARPVHVHHLLCRGTIEAHVSAVAGDKGLLSDTLLGRLG
jgi:hypothetical protein